MFNCTCCSPSRTYLQRKSLYRHQRLNNSLVADPRQQEAEIRRANYYANPKTCECCSMVISYEDFTTKTKKKFCSRSCAAKSNNAEGKIGISRIHPINCIVCDAPRGKNAGRFCSNTCQGEYEFKTIHLPQFNQGLKTNPQILKKCLTFLRGHKCEDCESTTWKDVPIPLETDHINGDSTNNFPTNLRLLCPNCHALTPTAKGKNRGNGRWARRQRYAEGKSS